MRSSLFQANLDAVKTHGSMAADYVSMSDQRFFRIPVPPVRDQASIAHILGTLDDKIELNRRTNETLEAMAKALFKSWFIDFDPVHAKAAGNLSEGLDSATASLFPASFQDSPLGKIPKGWRVGTLGEQVEAVKGLSYNGSGLSDAGIPLHNLNSVYEGGGYKFEGIKWYTGEYRERHLIRPGDVIVANTEQGHDCLLLGYAAVVPEAFGQKGLFTHHTYRVRPLPGSSLTGEFIWRLLNSPQMHDVVSGYGNGTTVNMMTIDALQKPVLVLPNAELIERFSHFSESVRKRREKAVEENKALAKARDILLPRLLSGELKT